MIVQDEESAPMNPSCEADNVAFLGTKLAWEHGTKTNLFLVLLAMQLP